MRREPPVDRERLIQTMRRVYRIPAESLTFVPVGFDAACYVVDRADGERQFLKLWPSLRSGQIAATRLHESLVLTRALHDRALDLHVPYPILTASGQLWADLDAMPFALFPLLPGHAPAHPVPPALRREFARTIAAIHRATPHVSDVLPARDAFSIPDEAGLTRCLAAVERIGSGERPGLQSLRRLAVPRATEIRSQHARLQELQERVRQLHGPLVLCHTDLGGDNMLVDEQGQFSVLDWDYAMLAPPEHDLWSAVGDGFSDILASYWREGGARPLHLEHFEFYLLRRYLGDMTARLERIIESDNGDEDDELLRGMEAYGFSRWAALDATLTGIALALGERGKV